MRHETKQDIAEAETHQRQLRQQQQVLLDEAALMLRRSRLQLTRLPGPMEGLVWRERGDKRRRYAYLDENTLSEMVPPEISRQILSLERQRIILNNALAFNQYVIQSGERYLIALHRVDALATSSSVPRD